MDPITLDLLLTVAASAVVIALGVVGVLALPWTDRELAASADAFRVLGRGLVSLLRRRSSTSGSPRHPATSVPLRGCSAPAFGAPSTLPAAARSVPCPSATAPSLVAGSSPPAPRPGASARDHTRPGRGLRPPSVGLSAC